MQIVGIAPPVREELLDRAPPTHVYVPFGRNYGAAMHMHVKLSSATPGPASMAEELAGIDMIIPRADSRGFGILSEGSLFQWPVPGNVLELYHLPEWNAVKWRVHKRDGYRCTYVDWRGRCRVTRGTGTIEAHHLKKVKELYAQSRGDWATFVRLALDPDNIATLCFRHHLMADRPGRPIILGASARPKARRSKTRTRRRG